MRTKLLIGGVGLIMLFGIFIIAGHYVYSNPLPSADARSSDNRHAETVNINEVVPAEEPLFNLSTCSSQGDPNAFYNIGSNYSYIPVSSEAASYEQDYAVMSYNPTNVGSPTGRVLGYQIAQANPDEDPCGCFSDLDGDGTPDPPPACPEQGCVVDWQSPEAGANLSGEVQFVIGIDPTISCTELYIWAYADPQKQEDLGWIDCGNDGFTLGNDNNWYATCNLTPYQAYDDIYLQPRANGCYYSIYLTDDPVNNPNEQGDIYNPVYGPFHLPGPTAPEYCLPNWQCDAWDDLPCVGGYQTRGCTDLNNCGVTVNRPNLTRSCTSPDTETNTNSDNVDNEEENAGGEEITPPTAVMTIPKEGDTLTGSITLTARVEGTISSLEFYWDKSEASGSANRNVLIGAGHPLLTNSQIWEKSWDTTQTPSGDYQVYARIADLSGDFYLSNKINITLNHEVVEEPEELPSASENPDAETDTDNEGIPDVLEQELGTNINNPDTDNDSETDFSEVINDSNPVGEGSMDDLVALGTVTKEKAEEIKNTLQKIVFDEPKTSGVEKPGKMAVLEVNNISERIGQNKIIFNGRGPANTYLNLFIYSSPIVVTTKTDASGNFVYTLDKHLADGQHEVYVTVTDETGKIKEKSAPFTFFVRKAAAVSEEDYFRADVNVQSETATTVNTYLWLALALVAAAIILLLIAYIVGRKR